MADLTRLGNTVADLVQRYDAADDVPVVEAVAPEPELVVEAVAQEPELVIEAEEETSAETVTETPAESESEIDAFAAVVADAGEEVVWNGDVSFDDLVSGESTEGDSDGESDSSPQKPAWLSVARQSAAS
jgi:hypothetical protein